MPGLQKTMQQQNGRALRLARKKIGVCDNAIFKFQIDRFRKRPMRRQHQQTQQCEHTTHHPLKVIHQRIEAIHTFIE
jgi:hypothetical protein